MADGIIFCLERIDAKLAKIVQLLEKLSAPVYMIHQERQTTEDLVKELEEYLTGMLWAGKRWQIDPSCKEAK